MEQKEIAEIIGRQRAFFETGATLDPSFRIQALKRLYSAIQTHEAEFQEAVKAD